jgi:curved DNA-binding protein CbpA
LKNYYFILSLNIYATDAEIKHSYRRLALQFHPDKNPSPEAESIFKEVNEAYEVLGDPLRKAVYDQMLRGAPTEEQVQEPVRTHRDPRYRPKPTTNAPRRPTHREELLAMMASNLRYTLMISRLTLLFSIVLITDYSLPPVKTITEIQTVSKIKEKFREFGGNGSNSFKIEFKDGKNVSVSREAASKLVEASKIGVYRSAWFSIPVTIEDEFTHYRTDVQLSIYGNFIFWPILLLLTSLVGTFYWKGVEFRFNVGVVNFILFLLTVIFLNVHKF